MAISISLYLYYHGSVSLLLWWVLPETGIMFRRGGQVNVDAGAGDVDLPVRSGVAVVVLEVVDLKLQQHLNVGLLEP